MFSFPRLLTTTGRALGASALLLWSGCSAAPLQTREAQQTVIVDTPPTAFPLETVVNELATGSGLHSLTAGDVALSANYWSTLGMDKWTASANKPISFSLQGKLGTDDGQAVYLARVSVETTVEGPTGALPAPSHFSDSATISPGYLIKSPYSYSQTFTVPAIDPKATSATFSLTFELLVQSAPGSSNYAKQTATDQIVVAIAQ